MRVADLIPAAARRQKWRRIFRGHPEVRASLLPIRLHPRASQLFHLRLLLHSRALLALFSILSLFHLTKSLFRNPLCQERAGPANSRSLLLHTTRNTRHWITRDILSMSRHAISIALLAAATRVIAQTSTTCNPLKSTCPQDPALGTTFDTTFNTSMTEFDPNFFNVTAGADLVSFGDNGADLTIAKQGDSVTVETAFYIMFGSVEMLFQAASGQGIISTFNLLSDDLDEVDWEIMGGNTSFVENNYYGWGNQSQYNAKYFPTHGWNGGAQGGIHNFTVNWSKEEIQWIMDGDVVRTAPYLPPGEYPQSPCYLKFGIWAGGDPTLPKGTIKWAGGPTDYSKG